MIKVATVCTGIGSPEQALKELGIPHEIVFGCEIDKYAKQTYLANFTPQFMFEDMTKPDILDHYSDLFLGGIPCQSFSLAGKRKGELDPRGTLFYDFYNYVKVQKPKYFIIENVKGLLSDAGGKTFQNWLDLLGQSVNTEYAMFPHEDSLLYNLHWTVLNSKDFGVPQNRERVFLVGLRNDLPNDFRFPIGEPLKLRLKDILEKEVAEKYYLSDKMLSGFNLTNSSTKIGFINQDTQASAVFSADGTSPTITSGTHGYAQGYVKVPEATQKGFDIATEGDSINISQPNSKTRRGRVGKQIANTLETQANQVVVEPQIIGYTRDEKGDVVKRHLKDEAGTIHTSSGSGGNTDQFVMEPFCVAMRGRNPENPSDRTTGAPTEQRLEPNSNGIVNTITSVQKDNLIVEPKIIQHNIPEMVSVRKFEVDIPKLQECLKIHKNFKTIKSIATALDVPKTMVEHWFRADKCFSIPDAKYWFQLKELLAIHTEEFDASITEFEEKENIFEKANRVYDEQGIAPTITSTSADERILTNSEPKLEKVAQLSGKHESSGRVYSSTGLSPTVTAKQGGGHEPYTKIHNRIRRLTPTECMRLQGFPDSFIKPCSETQQYKQAGNTITVNVIKAILKNLLKAP